jgi:hypothetical protein
MESLWKTAIHLVRQPMWLPGAAFLIGTFVFSALALYVGRWRSCNRFWYCSFLTGQHTAGHAPWSAMMSRSWKVTLSVAA